MTVAAFVVALLALGVSGIALRDTHRMKAIEEDRRHEERTPRFTASLTEMANAAPFHRLHLHSETDQSFDRLEVHLQNAPTNLQFTHGQRGTDPSHAFPVHDAFVDAGSGAPLPPFGSAVWQVEIPTGEWPDEGLLLIVKATAGTESWTVRARADAPDSWIVMGRDF